MDAELNENDVFLSEKKRWYLIEVIERIKLKRTLREKEKVVPIVVSQDFKIQINWKIKKNKRSRIILSKWDKSHQDLQWKRLMKSLADRNTQINDTV